MYRLLDDLAGGTAGFDDVIDVRSPGEFAEDHALGAINLPVLSDAERARVGTIYVQESKFEARRLGAALIARNVAAHLEGPLRDRAGGWTPLLYCWRGGQRSQSMALILSQIGWRTSVLKGGYKTYRRGVVERLYEQPLGLRLLLLDGPTGVGKTRVLAALAAQGVQTLDLEGLANHRGSLFGDMGEQPSQKMFESRLAAALAAFDPARPVVVEAESSRVGERFLPSMLWGAMTAAARIELDAPLADRAAHLSDVYRDQAQDLDGLIPRLDRLPGPHSRETRSAWRELAQAGQVEALAAALMAEHYDPAYARSARRDARSTFGRVNLLDLSDQAVYDAARAIGELIGAASRPDL
jgi:tRNA 2-selenouridine synthase